MRNPPRTRRPVAPHAYPGAIRRRVTWGRGITLAAPAPDGPGADSEGSMTPCGMVAAPIGVSALDRYLAAMDAFRAESRAFRAVQQAHLTGRATDAEFLAARERLRIADAAADTAMRALPATDE